MTKVNCVGWILKFFEIFVKTDDDFMMQVIPALSLTIIFVLIGWQYLPPELISVDPALAKLA